MLYGLLVIVLLLLGDNLFLFMSKSRQRVTSYHVTVKFVGGNRTKLVLNAEQYSQLQAFLNQVDGHFEIGDDQDHVKLYREHICAVEVKMK